MNETILNVMIYTKIIYQKTSRMVIDLFNFFYANSEFCIDNNMV